ncbi:alpha/beta hydrolase [Reichenbachiella sp.]|uniref:alpha/beta fold hydrolase n=1 Tax=Reichenbachiella sp. TaxID=2184521 RepID=UPI003299D540
METFGILRVSEVSTNKNQICSKNSGIFLSAMNVSPQLYKFPPDLQLEYMLYGVGKKFLICFHGFGQDHSVFEGLTPELPDYQIISINLLFHGKSDRNHAPKYLRHSEWKNILKGLLDELGIQRFSVLGYSMGGRYLASTLLSFRECIEHCIFIAPDGIVKRMSYEFATFSLGPQQLFRYFMNNPRPFFFFLNIIERTRLMNPWTIKFSRSQLKDPKQRYMVLRSWITLKKLRVRQNKLVAIINEVKFSTTFIFGKYDLIIAPKRHFKFLNKLQNTKVIILDTGHSNLVNESIPKISQQLNRIER